MAPAMLACAASAAPASLWVPRRQSRRRAPMPVLPGPSRTQWKICADKKTSADFSVDTWGDAIATQQEQLEKELREQEQRFQAIDKSLTEARQAVLRAQVPTGTASDVGSAANTASAANSAAKAGPSFAEMAAAEAPKMMGSLFETLARAATATVARLKAPEEQKRREEGMRLKLKSEMLLAIAPLDRGANAPFDKRAIVESIARQLEALNPTPQPMKSTLNNGKWNLVYTTSDQLLGKGKPEILRPAGPLFFCFNPSEGRAMVTQTWPVKEERARLRAVSPTGMLMDFEKQKLFGLFTLPSTSTAREYSFVETVYLDIDMRVMRGANDTLYVLIMDDPFYVIPPEGKGSVSFSLLPTNSSAGGKGRK